MKTGKKSTVFPKIMLRQFFIFLVIAFVQMNTFIPKSSASVLQKSYIDFNIPPKITLVRKLLVNRYFVPFVNLESDTAGVTWSSDGSVLAAYTNYHQVLNLWNSSGDLIHEIPLFQPTYLPPPILAFLDGTKNLVVTPSSLRQGDVGELNRAMLTILNIQKPIRLQDIYGDKPVGFFRDNQAVILRISSDQALAAVVAGRMDDRRQVSLYSTVDWHRKKIFRDTVMRLPDFVSSIAFSPDNKTLAVGRHYGQIQIYSLLSGTLIRFIDAFPDIAAPNTPTAAAISFSPDSRLIAVGGGRGGGNVIVDGVRRPALPSDAIRIFNTETGKQVESASGFIAGLWTEETNSFAWSPRGDFLAFVSGEGDLHIWDPYHPSRPHGIVPVGRNALSLSISPDGSTIAVGVPSGILLFDVEK